MLAKIILLLVKMLSEPVPVRGMLRRAAEKQAKTNAENFVWAKLRLPTFATGMMWLDADHTEYQVRLGADDGLSAYLLFTRTHDGMWVEMCCVECHRKINWDFNCTQIGSKNEYHRAVDAFCLHRRYHSSLEPVAYMPSPD